jgi:hypothetical protein
MQGEVVYLYAFDVASEIVTERVGDILAAPPTKFELPTSPALPRDLRIYKPLTVESAPRKLAGHVGDCRAVVRVYQIGVVSVVMRMAFEVGVPAELIGCHEPRLADGRSLSNAARALCQEVCRNIQDAMIDPAPLAEPEAYTVFCLTDLAGPTDAVAWVNAHRRELAELITAAPAGTLSEMQINEVHRLTRSYNVSDAVIIDWDAAVVVELDGYLDDVLYVLEVANLQLEEYKVIDERLDIFLDRAYDDLGKQRYGVLGRYSRTLAELRLIRVDLTKLNDEVSHISKFIGDWYLARVYLAGAERFYLNQWRQSVENRLGQLDELYSVVDADINNRRMVWLEILIVVFFAIDLLMLWFKE